MALLIVVILIITQLFLASRVKSIHWVNSKEANMQLLIQFCMYTGNYVLLVAAHKVLADNKPSLAVAYLVASAIRCVFSLFQLCIMANRGQEIPAIRETAKPILKIVAFTWYGIFGSLCSVNYALTVMFPGAYEGIVEMTFAERAFNVVYYTFSVMLSYTGNGISAIGVLSRSVEMVEILCCYVIIGIVIVNTIGKASEKV